MSEGVAGVLPENAVLLHIGPYKTGTTGVQSALFAAKPRLKAYGVAYPGRWRRLVGAGYAAMRWAPPGEVLPDLTRWQNFAAGVRQRSDLRVCVSTEDFGTLRDRSTIERIVADLGGPRVHVVVVARALHRVLPSHWQERIKSGDVRTYPDWLRSVLVDPDDPDTTPDLVGRTFWASHDIRSVAEAWIPVIGRDNVHVVVADDTDHDYLLRVFEQLLGLPPELLQSDLEGNESLSLTRLEVLRRLNVRAQEADWPDEFYRRVVKFGLVKGLRTAEPSDLDRRIPALPSWAVERARELSRKRAAQLDGLAVDVIGNTRRLLVPDDYPAGDDRVDLPDVVPVAWTVDGIVAMVEATLRREQARAKSVAASEVGDGVASHSSAELLREVLGRLRHRLRRRRGGRLGESTTGPVAPRSASGTKDGTTSVHGI